ncbi:regulatory protein RecX [Bdellovibrionota bacterium FG-2]
MAIGGTKTDSPDDPDKAYAVALGRVGRREGSARELESYLRQRGFSEKIVAFTVKRLVIAKLVDDSRYTRMLIRQEANQGRGAVRIRLKLKQKGVDLAVQEVRNAAEELTGVSELDMAKKLLERKYPEVCGKDRAALARAYQYLLRRGYSHEVARKALGAFGRD